MSSINAEQAPPLPSTATPSWELVIADLMARRDRLEGEATPIYDAAIVEAHERDNAGVDKYGVALAPFNGRDSLIDAVQEAMDLTVYLRTALEEGGGPSNDLRLRQLYADSFNLWLRLRAFLFKRDGR